MLIADYVGYMPEIEVESKGYVNRNTVVIKIGEVEFTLNEADAKELHECLEKELYNEIRENLIDEIDSTRDKLYEAEDKISDLKDYIEQIEERLEG